MYSRFYHLQHLKWVKVGGFSGSGNHFVTDTVQGLQILSQYSFTVETIVICEAGRRCSQMKAWITVTLHTIGKAHCAHH